MNHVNAENHSNGRIREELKELNFVDQEANLRKNEPPGKATWKDVRYQIWAVNVGHLFTVNDGMTFAFSNLIIDELDCSTGSWFGKYKITLPWSTQPLPSIVTTRIFIRLSFVASIIGLSIPIGSLLSGPLMDRFGRKTTNVILAIPCIPAWFITYFASLNSLLWLFASRCLVGLAMGMATSNVVYASEISHKSYRPLFLSLVSFHFAFGILFVSILQVFLTWRQVAFASGVFFSVSLVLTLFFTPESPIWLAHFRGDWSEARKSLKWLNPNPTIFEEEWKELIETRQHRIGQSRKNAFNITNPAIYKPLLLVLILFTLQEATFVYALIVYTVKILPLVSQQLGEIMKDEAFALLGVLRFVSNIFCCILSLKVGRRPLLIISSLGMAFSSVLLVILPYCVDDTSKAIKFGAYEWSSITMFFMVIVFGTFGVMTLPWCLTAELLPHEARSQGSGVTLCYSYTLLFVFAKIFPFLLETFDPSLLFAFIAGVSVLMALFVFFYIPETLGKSFAEIEKYFQK